MRTLPLLAENSQDAQRNGVPSFLSEVRVFWVGWAWGVLLIHVAAE